MLGVYVGAPLVLAAILVGAAALAVVGLRATRGLHLLANVGLSTGAFVVVLLVADVGYGLYRNAEARATDPLSPEARAADPVAWHGEIFPRRYYPTEAAFFVYKPDTEVTADVYGEFYHTEMHAAPLVTDSVLERKRLTYRIGPHGLRDTDPLSGTRVFAIGDSFAMGYGTTEGETWVDLLEAALGEPVYNAGVSSTGPRQQLQLLEHLLSTHTDSLRIERVLWMLFEGNDLENSYAEDAPPPPDDASLAEGTLLAPLLSIPSALQRGSVLRQLRRVVAGGGARFDPGGLDVDGLRTPYPLYHSTTLGYRLFNPLDVERATMDRAYVERHPNRPRLERTLDEMAELARRYGFDVTVVIAPSAARLHGPSFEDFPALEPPHFIEFLAERSRAVGFETVDLLQALEPWAETGLLYYRDDHHWNRLGNARVAEILSAHLGG